MPEKYMPDISQQPSSEQSASVSGLTSTDRDSKLLDYHAGNQWQMRNPNQFPGVLDDNRDFVEQQIIGLAHTDLASFQEKEQVEEGDSIRSAAVQLNDTLDRLNDRLSDPLNEEAKYFTALDISTQTASLRTALGGVAWSVSRDFFTQAEDVAELFYGIRNKASQIFDRSFEIRKQLIRVVLPFQEPRELIQKTDLAPQSLVESTTMIARQCTDVVKGYYPDHPDQQALVKAMLNDLISALREEEDVTPQLRSKLTLMTLPLRFESWIRHKKYSSINQNYTGGGVENIAVADELLAVDDQAPLKIAAEVMSQHYLDDVIGDLISGNTQAIQAFLAEIGQIYDSRRKISEIMEAAMGNSELLLPAEAMSLVAELTNAMDKQDLSEVIRLVELLEDREIDLYHVTPNTAAFNTILGSGRLNSAWANHRYADTFFGGGLYFWGAQQEDWLKGGEEAFHIKLPARDLFLVRNKYNNTMAKGSNLSALMYDAVQYHHPQKKNNILAMLPANSIKVVEHKPVEDKPLNNEGYTVNRLETITQFEVEESHMLWRCDKHYGKYDTEYFISPAKEAQIKELLGKEIRVQRAVTTAGFLGGEYDRLVVPRSVSHLKASAVAYSLRIPEVVYEDKLDDLGSAELTRRKELLAYYAQLLENWLPDEGETLKYISERLDAITGLSTKDRLLVRFFFKDKAQTSEQFFVEKAKVAEALGGDWPKQTDLETHTPKPEYFLRDSTIHGTPHILRVFLNAEFLGRLAVRDSKVLENYTFDQDALRIAVMLHDTRRKSDSSSDYKHGQRAAEFSDGLPELDGVDRKKAKRLMLNHCLVDAEVMLLEEKILKDADALDRFRFKSGPDWRYMHTPFAKQIRMSALYMAELSQLFLENGYRRSEAVTKAALALELVEPKTETDMFADIEALLAEADSAILNHDSETQIPIDHPSSELFHQVDRLLDEANEVIRQFEHSIRSLDFDQQRELVKNTTNDFELRVLISAADEQSLRDRRIIRTFACINARTPETIRLLFKNASNLEKSLLATNQSTPVDILTEIAESNEEESVRRAVLNPATPLVTKQRFSQILEKNEIYQQYLSP